MVGVTREVLVKLVIQAVIAVLLTAAVVYSVVAQIPIPDQVMQLVFLVLAVYFGFEARQSVRALRAASNSRRKRRG